MTRYRALKRLSHRVTGEISLVGAVVTLEHLTEGERWLLVDMGVVEPLPEPEPTRAARAAKPAKEESEGDSWQ